MPAPKRSTYIGTIKDEGDVISINFDTGGSLILNLNGFNPDADRAALLPFVGKRVAIDGTVPPRSDYLNIDSTADIKPVAAPKHKPHGPKP